MPNPIYELKADLDADGTFETDWSVYLKGLSGLTLWRDDALSAFGGRAVTFLMDNEDKRFSPKNTSGPYSPDLKRGVRVQLKGTVTTPAVTNLVDNPSQETDAVGWISAARIITDAKYGAACGRVTGTGLADSFSLTLRGGGRIPVTAGLAYIWKSQNRKVGGSGALLWAQGISWYNSGGSVIQTDFAPDVALPADGPWTEALAAFTAPVGAVTCILGGLETSGLGVGEFMHVDGAFFYQSSDQTIPYCDGDQAAATWAGTAHESTSSRVANPQTSLFTGVIRNFALSRTGEPLMQMAATGHLESLSGVKIKAGPFTRKAAKLVINRLLDIMTPDELIDDGAFRVVGDNIVLASAILGGIQDSAKVGGADPDEYGALEGDGVWAFQAPSPLTDKLAGTLDMTSRTDNDTLYDLRHVLSTTDADMDGEQILVELFDNIGVVGSSLVTLVDTVWVYDTIEDVQFNGGATSRSIRWTFNGTILGAGGVPLDFIIDGLSMTKSKNRIARTLPSGASQFDADLEYLDGFERSALATLEEAVKSAGGWWYEDGAGGFVFEDFDTRPSAAVPKLRLTDTEILDGHYVTDPQYDEPAAGFYNRVRVASFGDVSLLTDQFTANARRVAWAFEPLPRAYGNNAQVKLGVQFLAEEGDEGVIARRAVLIETHSAGAFASDARPLSGKAVASPWIENYGRAATIGFKAGAGGITLTKLKARARLQNRSTTERTFVEKEHAGTGGDQPRLLELETPAQGYKTQLMADLADWADRYGNGLSKVRLELEATTVELLLEVIARQPGLPVRYRQVTGPGASMADELYYVEGWQLDHDVQSAPRLTLLLEEAT